MFTKSNEFSSFYNLEQKSSSFSMGDNLLGEDPFAHWYDNEPLDADNLLSQIPETFTKIDENLEKVQSEVPDKFLATTNEPITEKFGEGDCSSWSMQDKDDESTKVIQTSFAKKGQNSARKDVVRKSLIRGLKRYYIKIFANGNPLIVSFSSPEGSQCLEDIEKYCEENFKNQLNLSEDEEMYSLTQLLNTKEKVKINGLSENMKTYCLIRILLA